MLQKTDVNTLTLNPFEALNHQWMLVTAGSKDDCNTMTASWGGLGIMWNRPVATAYLRPQRHTKRYIDRGEYFTLSFMPEAQRQNLVYCGRVSGREEDKVKKCGFTVLESECGAPYFAEAELVLVCRKLYRQTMTSESILVDGLDAQNYPDKDYHDMYIAEIVEAYRNA